MGTNKLFFDLTDLFMAAISRKVLDSIEKLDNVRKSVKDAIIHLSYTVRSLKLSLTVKTLIS